MGKGEKGKEERIEGKKLVRFSLYFPFFPFPLFPYYTLPSLFVALLQTASAAGILA